MVQETYTQTDGQYGDLLSQYDGTNTLHHQYDALGSTDALINDAETATDRYQYRAFGLESHTSGSSANPFTFVGQKNYYRDSETDLYLLGTGTDGRFYDPASGRFLTEDPLGYRAGDINLFRYVGNNPVNQIDPSGNVLYTEPGSTEGNAALQWLQQLAGFAVPYMVRSINPAVHPTDVVNQTVGGVNRILRKVDFFSGGGEDYAEDFWRRIYVGGMANIPGAPTCSVDCRVLRDILNTRVLRGRWELRRVIYQTTCPDTPSGPQTFGGAFNRWCDLNNPQSCAGPSGPLGPIAPPSPAFTWPTLGQVLTQVGNWATSLPTQALSALENVGRTALAALLRAGGFDPQKINDFFETLDEFGNRVWEAAQGFIADPEEYWRKLREGGEQGFREFFGNIQMNLVGPALTWFIRQIGGALNLVLPQSISLANVLPLALQFLEVTWPQILSYIVNRLRMLRPGLAQATTAAIEAAVRGVIAVAQLGSVP